jgi:hypothetical protein
MIILEIKWNIKNYLMCNWKTHILDSECVKYKIWNKIDIDLILT